MTVLLIDIFIVIVSMLFACLLQYGSSFMLYKDSSFVFPVVFAVLSNVCFFHLFHTYVGVILLFFLLLIFFVYFKPDARLRLPDFA